MQLKADSAVVKGKRYAGYTQPMQKAVIDAIIAYDNADRERYSRFHEKTRDDSARFAGLAPVSVNIKPLPQQAKPISDKLIGIFFEDINYGADGGLYAELVQNRDFEYSAADHKGWDSKTAWSGDFDILVDNPIHVNNPHYARLAEGKAMINIGFDSIAVVKGDNYRFSIKARAPKALNLKVELIGKNDKVLAAKSIKVKAGDWSDYKVSLKPAATTGNARLRLTATNGCVDLDMVSLFPAKTFKGRENGLRIDLAQTLADLKPQFVRFPGGCVAHGKGIDNIYDWKGSIGPARSSKTAIQPLGLSPDKGVSATTSISCSARILALSLCLLSLPVFLARIRISTPTIPTATSPLWDSSAVCLGKKWSNILRIFSTLSNTLTVVLIPNGALNVLPQDIPNLSTRNISVSATKTS